MTFSLLNLEGLMFVFRWIHFFAGVTWIGMLYYFNFVQGAFFGETDAATKSNCVQKLVPRALWWFRWGAMFTFFSGLLILGLKGHTAGFEIYATSWGVSILMGAALGALMWAKPLAGENPSQKPQLLEHGQEWLPDTMCFFPFPCFFSWVRLPICRLKFLRRPIWDY